VLFLDEAAEFSRTALDSLRQPLEAGSIDILRAGFTARFPARFHLVLATNPCPCGQYGVRGGDCTCVPMAIRRYASRISGPLRDRLDIELHIARAATSDVTSGHRGGTTSDGARQRVNEARERARSRWVGTPWSINADVPGSWLRRPEHRLSTETRTPLDRALERGALTLRGYDRVLRIAWTMADLSGIDSPTRHEVGRALLLKNGIIA